MYNTCSYSFQVHKQHSPIVELTTEDISAFIIPPPPAASAPGGLRKRPLNRPAAADPPLFTERDIQEVRVAKDQLEVRAQRPVATTAGSPPKLTTLQERITQLRLNDSTAKLPVKESMGLNLQKDRYGYPISGSGGGDGSNLKSPPLRGESSSAVGPLVRRSSMATAGGGGAAETPPTAPRGAALNQQRREVFMRQVSSPDMSSSKPFVLVAAEGESPPPPPPRANIPTGFGTLGRRPPPPSSFQVTHVFFFSNGKNSAVSSMNVNYMLRLVLILI
jgi:hypothetical protein